MFFDNVIDIFAVDLKPGAKIASGILSLTFPQFPAGWLQHKHMHRFLIERGSCQHLQIVCCACSSHHATVSPPSIQRCKRGRCASSKRPQSLQTHEDSESDNKAIDFVTPTARTHHIATPLSTLQRCKTEGSLHQHIVRGRLSPSSALVKPLGQTSHSQHARQPVRFFMEEGTL